jgi:AraC-like DNA-binding protein
VRSRAPASPSSWQVGLAPKACARLLRFEHAVELLGAPGASPSSVAAEAGYYDQAHLDRDCRQFAGCTPTEVRSVQDPIAEAS